MSKGTSLLGKVFRLSPLSQGTVLLFICMQKFIVVRVKINLLLPSMHFPSWKGRCIVQGAALFAVPYSILEPNFEVEYHRHCTDSRKSISASPREALTMAPCYFLIWPWLFSLVSLVTKQEGKYGLWGVGGAMSPRKGPSSLRRGRASWQAVTSQQKPWKQTRAN